MKIAVFENEWVRVKPAFTAANIIYFDEKLIYDVFVSSQDFGDFNRISEYSLAIVDLDLSIHSELDGFSIIKEITNLNRKINIVILTGSSSVKQKLDSHGIKSMPVISKPVDIDDIYNKISKFIL